MVLLSLLYSRSQTDHHRTHFCLSFALFLKSNSTLLDFMLFAVLAEDLRLHYQLLYPHDYMTYNKCGGALKAFLHYD